MNRNQYKELKLELKELGSIIRSDKQLNKQLQREGKFTYETYYSINSKQFDYRTKHIFMSLVRGKSRVQIENNFETKELETSVENKIQKLCIKYDYDMDMTEKFQVLSITPKDVQIEGAA